MKEIINHFHIPIVKEVDILVIGAGSAGCIAAISAAATHGNHSVMLLERYGFPGGSSTQMLDTFYGFFTPGDSPKKIVGGWPDKVVDMLDRQNAIFLRPNTYGAGTGVNYNPEKLKYTWDKLITNQGIHYLLHTTLIDVVVGNENYTCIIWNKGGFGKITARRVIDASGDADFCHLAGIKYEVAGQYEPVQSMTTTFRMSNVDLELYGKAGGKKMLKEKMQKDQSHQLPRKEGSAHEMNARKCISTVAVKVAGFSGLDAFQLTEAEIEGRRQAFLFEQFFQQEIPGFAQSNIIGLSNQIGVRETRRVYGMHRLTKAECLEAKIPDDSIFLCGAPIEDHRLDQKSDQETHWEYIPGTGIYGVPYGCIVPEESHKVWMAGRCFSATHDAHASCRSMAQTMSMGQAAGIAAALSIQKDEAANELSVNTLREQLHKLGTVLEIPDQEAFTDRNGWHKNTQSRQ